MIPRILTAGVLIPLVLAAIYLSPLVAFVIAIDLVLLLALWELSGLAERLGARLHWPSWVVTLLVPWAIAFRGDLLIACVLAGLLASLAAVLVLEKEMRAGMASASTGILAIVYLGLPLGLLSLFHPGAGNQGRTGADELVAVLATLWVSDSLAYFVGRSLGRHKILPRLSPKKSLEGYLAGIAGPIVLLPLAGLWLLPDRHPVFLVAAALVIALGGILGDLFESMLKRGAQVKDSSGLLPGHGGVLDRMDSLLTALPAYYILVTLLESAGV